MSRGYLPHAAPGEVRDGELHWNNGWFFSLMKDGWVRIRVKQGAVEMNAAIPPEEWAEILKHLEGR